MKLGYNTNGWGCHRWDQAFELIAELGYQSVAITVDHHCLDPYSADLPRQIDAIRQALERWQLSSVIETGARFLLNPRVTHDPTLVSATAHERKRRVDYLCRCVEIASEVGSEAVSFWSGTVADDASNDVALQRLAEGCQAVCEEAERSRMRLAFEPEPGMFIDSFSRFRQLRELVPAPCFGLTIDIGHVHCIEDEPITDYLREWRELIFNVHIEDMMRGVHEHLRFGEGEINFPPVLRTLEEIGYAGGVHVELSRHSHMAPTVAREAYDFLRNCLKS